jgi:hypothetical protein
MRITSGKVIDGHIEVEGEPLDDGTTVTVLAPEEDGTFELNAEDERALLTAIEEADHGDTLDANQILQNLRKQSDS